MGAVRPALGPGAPTIWRPGDPKLVPSTERLCTQRVQILIRWIRQSVNKSAKRRGPSTYILSSKTSGQHARNGTRSMREPMSQQTSLQTSMLRPAATFYQPPEEIAPVRAVSTASENVPSRFHVCAPKSDGQQTSLQTSMLRPAATTHQPPEGIAPVRTVRTASENVPPQSVSGTGFHSVASGAVSTPASKCFRCRSWIDPERLHCACCKDAAQPSTTASSHSSCANSSSSLKLECHDVHMLRRLERIHHRLEKIPDRLNSSEERLRPKSLSACKLRRGHCDVHTTPPAVRANK
jgi:hypothetical protein